MAPIFKKSPARLAGNAVLGMQTDDRLVALAREGHERAFEVIVERYRKPLIRYCGRVLPASRAEDAVQQTFLNAHTALMRSVDPVELKPWLYKIAHNASLNLLRQNGWNYEQIPLNFDGVRRPDQVVEERIELEDTVAAVKELPERQRSALVMREFEGRSYTEIAALLGAGDGAVRQLLNRARVTLRSAATAMTPPPVALRLAEANPPGTGNGTRIAEVVGGLGSGGLAKAGAAALVAGSLAVGAAKAPLPVIGTDKPKQEAVAKPASVAASEAANGASNASAVSTERAPSHGSQRSASAPGRTKAKRESSRHRQSGGGSERGDRNEAVEEHHSGSGRTGTRERTTEDHSGPGSGTDDAVAQTPTDNSGPGGSGSDDAVPDSSGTSVPESPTVTQTDNSGPGSTESTSGSGSGSGSDDPTP